MRITKHDRISELRGLDSRADAIRGKLGISRPGTVTFLAERPKTDERIMVIADGYGGASLRIVEGNYPLDYVRKFEREFSTEEAANTEARALA